MFLSFFPLMPNASLPILAAALLTAGGCTYVDYAFEGYTSDQVWKAMVVAAETPTYSDWKVAENNVWVDKTEYRIEI